MINLTAQEAFDKSSIHMLTQGRAYDLGMRCCYYRTEDKRSCAVGCLIPDEEYDGVMEDGGYLPNNKRVAFLFDKNILPLLEGLQSIHDGDGDEVKWIDNYTGKFINDNLKKELRDLAKKFKLSAAVLDDPVLPREITSLLEIEKVLELG